MDCQLEKWGSWFWVNLVILANQRARETAQVHQLRAEGPGFGSYYIIIACDSSLSSQGMQCPQASEDTGMLVTHINMHTATSYE